jgi:Spy/CpxP family protein refolding chaperone
MKTFAKLSLLAVVAALIAAPIVVQAARSTDASGQARHPALQHLLQKRLLAQQIARRLHLTPEQKDSLQQVRAQARDEIRTIRADQNLTPAQKRAAEKAAELEKRRPLEERRKQKLVELAQERVVRIAAPRKIQRALSSM